MTMINKNPKVKVYESFQALYREKNYPHALIIASKYPQLKSTPEYAKIQERFQTLLQTAARSIKQGDKEKAKELIGEYARVEEKRFIVKLLLSHGNVFLQFLCDLENKNLENIYKAINAYPDFCNVPAFIEFDLSIKNTLDAIKAYIDDMEFEKIDEDFLVQISPFEPKARALEAKIKKTKKLRKLYETERFWECYDYIADHKELQSTLLSKLLEKYFQNQLQKAYDHIEKKEFEKAAADIKPFIKSKAKKPALEEFFAKAAAKSIEILLQKNNYLQAQKALFLSVEQFGKKEEFMQLAKIFYKKTGIGLVL